MKKNIAYIDASNLKFGILHTGWQMDYKHFRSWLRDKFEIDRAILFIGFIEENQDMYSLLQDGGFEIIFRPTFKNKNGEVKGNVDGELILQIVKDYYTGLLQKCILVASDGDYHCAVEFLKEEGVEVGIISPNMSRLSFLLKRTNVPIVDLFEFKDKLKVKRPPDMP